MGRITRACTRIARSSGRPGRQLAAGPGEEYGVPDPGDLPPVGGRRDDAVGLEGLDGGQRLLASQIGRAEAVPPERAADLLLGTGGDRTADPDEEAVRLAVVGEQAQVTDLAVLRTRGGHRAAIDDARRREQLGPAQPHGQSVVGELGLGLRQARVDGQLRGDCRPPAGVRRGVERFRSERRLRGGGSRRRSGVVVSRGGGGRAGRRGPAWFGLGRVPACRHHDRDGHQRRGGQHGRGDVAPSDGGLEHGCLLARGDAPGSAEVAASSGAAARVAVRRPARPDR